jgi:hypothetical protein
VKQLISLVALVLLTATGLPADRGQIMFHLIRTKGDEALLEPVIPAQIKVRRIKGENPDSTVFGCDAVPSVGEGEQRINVLRCGLTEYAVGDIILAKQ